METQKGEIVLYIYHIKGNKNENKNENGASGKIPAEDTPKQQAKLLSSALLARAATHYLTQHSPACLSFVPGQPPAPSWRTQKGSHGKPYFPDCPWLHLSISHSGAYRA